MEIQERGSCFGIFISIRTVLPLVAFFLVLYDSISFSESSKLSHSSFLLLYCFCIQQTARIVYIADFNVTIKFLPHFSFLSFFVASKYATLLARVLVICFIIFLSAFSHSSAFPRLEIVPMVKIIPFSLPDITDHAWIVLTFCSLFPPNSLLSGEEWRLKKIDPTKDSLQPCLAN